MKKGTKSAAMEKNYKCSHLWNQIQLTPFSSTEKNKNKIMTGCSGLTVLYTISLSQTTPYQPHGEMAKTF